MRTPPMIYIVALAGALALVSCGSDPGSAAQPPGAATAVATTAPLQPPPQSPPPTGSTPVPHDGPQSALVDRGPIIFEPGATSATVSGVTAGYDVDRYTFSANNGQAVTLTVDADTSFGYAALLTPSGQNLIDISGSTAVSGVLPETGTYDLRVGLVRAEAARDGQVNYTVSIGIPAAQSDPEGQDRPTVSEWALFVEQAVCLPSELPGSPGGEAVVPAEWAAGNADGVQFVVDGDLRPANLAREVAGKGNIQVPCNPTVTEAHTVEIRAYIGDSSGPSTSGGPLTMHTIPAN